MSELLNGDGLRSVGYLVAAALAALAALRARDGGEYAPIAFWCVASVVLLLFGAASYIDITSRVGGDVRGLVIEWGWYGERRNVQERTIVTVLFVTAMIAAITFVVVRGQLGVVSAGVIVLTLLVAFVAIRGASLHDVDSTLRRDAWSGVRLGSVLELGGIFAMGVLAAFAVARDITWARPSEGGDAIADHQI